MLAHIRKWLKGAFGSNGHVGAQTLYSRHEQLCYSYWDGEKDVKADPMVLWLALMDVWPDLLVDMKLANSPHSKASLGWKGQVEKARKVFSIKPFAEGGLTETGSMDVLYDYWGWCEDLKKNYPQIPTSPEATSPTSESTSAASPPTESTSASISTEAGNSTEGPTASK